LLISTHARAFGVSDRSIALIWVDVASAYGYGVAL
jgi:hypothetical protein